MKSEEQTILESVVKKSLDGVLKNSGLKSMVSEATTVKSVAKTISKTVTETAKSLIKEALVLTPKAFLNKSEKLSERTKEGHEILYKGYLDNFNKVSIKLDSALREDASSNASDFRSLKMDEQYNLNAIKLHELYFGNVGDLSSEITYESVPYIKLSRDFGNFEKWQYDFIACCMSAREGWAITYYEPFRNVYVNAVIDGHNVGLPLGAIPIIVMDMWAHAYYKDYVTEKKSYVIAMMRELNWNVIEARMVVAERSELGKIYQIIPLVNSQPEVMLTNASANAMPAPVAPQPSPGPNNPQIALGAGFNGGPVAGPAGGNRQQ